MQNIGWLDDPAAKILPHQQVWDERTEAFIIAEQYYFSLRWQGMHRAAHDYADEVNRLLKRYRIVSPLWIERAADAALICTPLKANTSVF